MTEAQIAAVRQRRLALAPTEDLSDPLTLGGDAAGELRDLGEYWLRLPAVAIPTP